MKVPGIKLSNGHALTYVAASGSFGYDGKGWPWDYPLIFLGLLDPCDFAIVMKTVTRNPRQGNFRRWNPMGCIRFLRDGVVNAYGLTNPGIDWFCKEVGPQVNSAYQPLIGSILGDPVELGEMASMLNGFDFYALELNLSCPNTADDLLKNTELAIRCVEAVAKVSQHPLIVKVSVAQDVPSIISQCEGMIEAISINSVPWRIAFPDWQSPLAGLGGGGVSGKAAQKHTWRLVEDLVRSTKIPVIGPSIWEYKDIDRVLERGANAVSFGSIFMPHPRNMLNSVRAGDFVGRHIEANSR